MIGVVLAGGASSRFGGQAKGLIPIRGRAMALHVADVLLQVCTEVVIEAPYDAGYETLGLPLIHAAPEHQQKGPLAGIAAGLGSTIVRGVVAFAPCDMPLLDAGVYRRLVDAVRDVAGAYAETAGGFEPLVAVLRVEMRPALLEALRADVLPRTHAVLDAAGAVRVRFDDGRAFTNVNTPAEAQRLG